MSKCCPSVNATDNTHKKYRCPVNGQEYSAVSSRTIFHNIARPWLWQAKDQSYYFCDDPECDIVYFGQDDSVLNISCLRTAVGIKERTKNSTLCYCFGVTFDAVISNPEIKNFIVNRTKAEQCACDIRNPSGRCCLKDFPKS
jgi:hypothetical protein